MVKTSSMTETQVDREVDKGGARAPRAGDESDARTDELRFVRFLARGVYPAVGWNDMQI